MHVKNLRLCTIVADTVYLPYHVGLMQDLMVTVLLVCNSTWIVAVTQSYDVVLIATTICTIYILVIVIVSYIS
jgi:hypothetical protein